MNPVDDERVRTLERALMEAHKARLTPPWEPGWVQGVMRDVRCAIKPHRSAYREHDVPHLVWRAAGVAAALAALLTMSLWMGSPKTVSEEAGLMAEDVEMGSLFFE
ncbi:MAG: hypothetical protein QM706_13850 [Nitrospira sp.]